MWLKTTPSNWSAPAGTLNQNPDKTGFLLHINFNGTEDADVAALAAMRPEKPGTTIAVR